MTAPTAPSPFPRVQSAPTTDPLGGDPQALAYARRLLSYIGPGLQAPDGSNNANDALAFGAAVARVRAALLSALDQAFPNTATVMLGELEQLHGIGDGSALTTSARQTRLTAAVRAVLGGSPQALVGALRVFDPAVAIVEYTAAQIAACEPNPTLYPLTLNAVFRFAVISSILGPTNADAVAVLEAAKPAHTTYVIASDPGPFKYGVGKFGVTLFGG